MRLNNSILPSTHIPGTMSDNMSPQVLPEAKVAKQNMKATITTSKSNSVRSDSKPSQQPKSERSSGRRTGGKANITRNNRYNSVSTPRNGGYVKANVSSSSSSLLDAGRFGYNATDSSPIKISSNKISLFTNPALPGEFDPVYTDVNLSKLAINVVKVDPVGLATSTGIDSVAKQNFKLIYYKMVSKLANNPSKAYQLTFSNINNVITYFKKIYVLLQRYYEIESILAWNPPASDYNNTLNGMRKLFDNSTMLFLKIEVVDMLKLYYLPTEFVNLANYMNQTYKTGSISDSKVFKFMSAELAQVFLTNSTTSYVATVKQDLANLANPTDDPTNYKLSAYTVAQISGFLEKDFSFGQRYSNGLPPAANCSIHDLEAYDIFINQSTLYSNTVGSTTLAYSFPDYPANANTPYVSHKEGNDISTFQIACQGISSTADSATKTGIIVEESIDVPSINGQTRGINKLWATIESNGLTKIYSRNAIRTNIFNDFHFVDLGSTFPFNKVSIPPSHTQLLYMNGNPVKDVATRDFSDKLYGYLK